MTKRTTPAMVKQVAPATEEEIATAMNGGSMGSPSDWIENEKWVRRDIERRGAKHDALAKEVAERIAGRGAYELEWLNESAVELWEFHYYRNTALALAKTVGDRAKLLGWLRDLEEEIVEARLKNFDRPSSTSPFHNASMIAKAEGSCRALRTIKEWLRTLER